MTSPNKSLVERAREFQGRCENLLRARHGYQPDRGAYAEPPSMAKRDVESLCDAVIEAERIMKLNKGGIDEEAWLSKYCQEKAPK